MRNIEFMWKTTQSKTGQCPAIYRTEGGYVIQGKMLDPGTAAQLLNVADDEDAVFVPADVIERIRDAV